jgi:hypothetical protein
MTSYTARRAATDAAHVLRQMYIQEFLCSRRTSTNIARVFRQHGAADGRCHRYKPSFGDKPGAVALATSIRYRPQSVQLSRAPHAGHHLAMPRSTRYAATKPTIAAATAASTTVVQST